MAKHFDKNNTVQALMKTFDNEVIILQITILPPVQTVYEQSGCSREHPFTIHQRNGKIREGYPSDKNACLYSSCNIPEKMSVL